MNQFLSRIRKNPFLILLIVLLHTLIINIIWLNLNHVPPEWDEANHTSGALEYAYFFSQLFHGNINLGLLLQPLNNPYFPLAKMIAGIMMTLTYPHITIAQFTGTLFFIGSIFFIYLVTLKMTKSRKSSLVAAALFAVSPYVIDRSRILSLDMGVLFFYVSSFYAYVESEYLQRKKYSIIFFILTTCAILTKMQAFTYYVPLAFFTLFYHKKRGFSKQTIANIIVGFIITLACVLPVFIFVHKSLISYYFIASKAQFTAPIGLLNLQTWLYYPEQLVHGFFPLYVFPLLAIGLWIFMRNTDKYKKLLIVQIIGIYLIYSYIPNKGLRFIFPIIPICIISFAIGIRKLLLKDNVFFMVFFYILTTGLLINNTLSFSLFPQLKPLFYYQWNVLRPYQTEFYPLEKLSSDMRKYIDSAQNERVLMIPNFEYFNINSINMYLRLNNVTHITATIPKEDTIYTNYFENRQSLIGLSDHAFALISDGDVGSPWLIDLNDVQQLELQHLYQQHIYALIENNKAEILSSYLLPSHVTIHLVRIKTD